MSLPRRLLKQLAAAAMAALVATLPAAALAAPDWLLRVVDGNTVRELPLEAVEAVGLETVTLASPFDSPGTVLSGVRLGAFLDTVGLGDAPALRFMALDEYVVVIERAEINSDQPLLVTRQGGDALTVETKGPYRLVYDSQAAEAAAGKAQTVNWIWNLIEIRAVR